MGISIRSFLTKVSLVGVGTLWACGGDDSTGPDQETPATVAAVAVTPASASLVSLGETVQLTAGARDASGNAIAGKTFTWSSSDENVATVSASGLVTAEGNGTATITATTDGVSGTASVTVSQTVDAVTVDPASATLTSVGETVQLTATASDAGGTVMTGKTFTWSSSDENVATVSASGLVTAAGTGTATITATTDGVSGTASVTVSEPQTPLYLRYESGDDFLSNQPSTSGYTSITLYNYGSGQSTEFQSIIGDAITGTNYGFSIWLGAGTSAGQTGTWTATILIEDNGVETTLATNTFTVPFNTNYMEYTADVTGIPGGTPGDMIILRLTVNDVSRGGILFGPSPIDSHILVPGIVTVSPVPSSPGVSAGEEVGVKVEVTAAKSLRYSGR